MKLRTSCILAAMAILAFGTLASANIHTITQVLYYNDSDGTKDGIGGPSPKFTCTVDTAACTNLLLTTWTPGATYGFNGFGFYATGHTLSSVSANIVDHAVGDNLVTNTSGSDNYYQYSVGISAKFSLNSALLSNFGTGSFLTDNVITASSAGNGSTACAADGPFTGTDGNMYDSTGCLFLNGTGSNSSADPSGFKNMHTNGVNVGSTASFTTASTVNIYEAVKGSFNAGSSGGSGTGNGTSLAGTEIDLIYTYDDGITSATPEPATLLLLGSGLSFLGAKLRRRSARS